MWHLEKIRTAILLTESWSVNFCFRIVVAFLMVILLFITGMEKKHHVDNSWKVSPSCVHKMELHDSINLAVPSVYFCLLIANDVNK